MFGAVNSQSPAGNFQKDTALHFLFTTNVGGGTPNSLADVARQRGLNADVDDFTIADLFTYFDCTDYVETSSNHAFATFIAERKSEHKKFVKRIKKSNLKVVGILSRAIAPRQQTWMDQVQRTLIDFSGLLDLVQAEATCWFVRPLLYRVLLVGLTIVGLNTLYIEKGETLGARSLSDYLGLLLWGLVQILPVVV